MLMQPGSGSQVGRLSCCRVYERERMREILQKEDGKLRVPEFMKPQELEYKVLPAQV